MKIQEGDPVILEIRTKDGVKKFRSRILKIYISGFVIAEPLYMGRPLDLAAGQRVEGHIMKKDAVYGFSSRIRYGETEGGRRSLILSWPEEWKRIQRRNDVRLEIRVPVEVWVEERIDEKKYMRLIEGTTRDLSAGGAKVESKRKINAEQVLLNLFFPEEKISLPARVLRTGTYIAVDPKTKKTKMLYWTSLKFLAIQEEKKQQILRFIFQKQQELRFKGLI
ncbi:MAG TPA: hypothetical protein GXZ26_06645 [Firmicutes bacterium]|nr:hypothetical protein [Bacillota bacterium]